MPVRAPPRAKGRAPSYWTWNPNHSGLAFRVSPSSVRDMQISTRDSRLTLSAYRGQIHQRLARGRFLDNRKDPLLDFFEEQDPRVDRPCFFAASPFTRFADCFSRCVSIESHVGSEKSKRKRVTQIFPRGKISKSSREKKRGEGTRLRTHGDAETRCRRTRSRPLTRCVWRHAAAAASTDRACSASRTRPRKIS
jgi:hypothetical protein